MQYMSESKFFQFPIGLLRVDCDITKVSGEQQTSIADKILSYGFFHAGKQAIGIFDAPEQAKKEAVRMAKKQKLTWFDSSCGDHIGAILGASVLEYTIGAIHSRNCGDPPTGKRFVRIRTDIIEDYRNHCLSHRELCVLAAIYCGIGSRAFVRLSRDQLRSMASGFSGIGEYVRCRDQTARDERLSIAQVKDTIEKLSMRSLFTKVTIRRRHSYFSHSLSASELIDAIARKHAMQEARKALKTVDQQYEEKKAKHLADAKKATCISGATCISKKEAK